MSASVLFEYVHPGRYTFVHILLQQIHMFASGDICDYIILFKRYLSTYALFNSKYICASFDPRYLENIEVHCLDLDTYICE